MDKSAQMIPALDFYLAPYVIMSFKEHLKALISDFDCLDLDDIKELNEKKVEQYKIKDVFELKGKERIWQLAINKTVKEAKQAMEGMIHDLNLMASRAGTQVPFSSVNLGTDFSPEGRLVTLSLLEALEDGVGILRKTAIYPITIFKTKRGINRLPEDPNYDLYKKSQEVACKRFYPTFVNLDATFNFSEEWKAEDPLRYETEAAIIN